METGYRLLRLPDEPARHFLLDPAAPQPRDRKRIRLFDCARFRYVTFARREVEQINDLDRLRSRVSELIRWRTRPGAPRPRAAATPPPRAPVCPARVVEDRTSVQPQTARALERLRDSDTPDGALRVAEYRARGGLVRVVLFDPGAHDGRTGQTPYLVVDGLPFRDEVVWVDGAQEAGKLSVGRTVHRRGRADAIERFRRWQADARLRLARKRAAADLAALARRHAGAPLLPGLPRSVLLPDPDDVRLAIRWCALRHRGILDRWYRDAGGEMDRLRRSWGWLHDEAREDLVRTLSARVAERAARWFYQDHDRTPPEWEVQDIAIQQLSPAVCRSGRGPLQTSGRAIPDYARFDLAVVAPSGTEYIDVKNARTRARVDETPRAGAPCGLLPAQGGTYTEHCVPRFKKGRDHETDVKIAGIASPAVSFDQLVDADYGHEDVTYLGESSESLCADLKREFDRDGELVLAFGSWRARGAERDRVFLPPWAFVLPPSRQHGAEERLACARAAIEVLAPGWVPASRDLWPLCIASGAASELPDWTAAIRPPLRSFVESLQRLSRRQRLTLPYVYLTVLSHFLHTLRARAPDERAGGHLGPFTPAQYRDWLFAHGRTDRPLGLYDPLRSVHQLVASLELMMRGDVGRMDRFREFRFSHAGVLRARTGEQDSHWVTLLFPYCGGGCGREHLVLGASGTEPCDTCGRLICPTPECRFCTATPACKRAAEERKGTRAARR